MTEYKTNQGTFHAILSALLHLIVRVVPLTSLVLDGHFGTPNALAMTPQGNLHLISKLRRDAALYPLSLLHKPALQIVERLRIVVQDTVLGVLVDLRQRREHRDGIKLT